MSTATPNLAAREAVPEHEQKRIALGYLHDAWIEALHDGIEGDCRPTRAYIDDNGIWRALMDGKWIVVPPRVVLQSLAPDGGSHICANRTGTIYCFMGGSPKS